MSVIGARLQDQLTSFDYPISRADLIRWAQENGASTEELQSLHGLPVEDFESPAQLADALAPLASG